MRRLLWLLLPGFGLLELVAHLLFAGRAPDQAAWQALVPGVDRLRRPGDLIVIAPDWAGPLARTVLGASRLPIEDVARPDQDGYRHAVEIGILGQRSRALAGWREVKRAQAGRFLLRRLENPAPRPALHRFLEALDPSRLAVSVLDQGRELPCRFDAHARSSAGGLGGHVAHPSRRFECPESSLVALTLIDDEAFRPRRCILAPPPERGTLRLVFRDAVLGRSVHGDSGSSFLLYRDRKDARVELKVYLGDALVGRHLHDPTRGWQTFDFPWPPGHAARGTVRFEVTSASPDPPDFCFHAETR